MPAQDIDLARVPAELPRGYAAVPVSPDEERAVLRLCAVLRREGDPASRAVVLRELLDGRVLLGCIADSGGRVRQWVELWIQDVDGLSSAAAALGGAVNNQTLDDRWTSRCRAMERLGAEGLIRTGWEERHPLPLLADATSLQPMHPVEGESGKRWVLCRDEALLASKDVAGYGASLARFLYIPELGASSPLAAVGGVEAGKAKPLAEVVGGAVPINPGGGLMMARPACAMGYEAFLSVVATGAAVGQTPAGAEWMLLGRRGRTGRLLEAFYLKLRVLADAFTAVRTLTAQMQVPLLNLRAESFGVRLEEPAPGLPVLWTARAVLLDPGDALQLPIRTADAVYYVPGRGSATGVYALAAAGHAVRGRAGLRLRRVVSESAGATILEGTLSTQERLAAGPNDLVWLRLGIGGQRVDLYATVEAESALASGELRVRTLPQQLGESAVAALKGSEGVLLPDVLFETIPLLSTPCDLHALAVLAVRTLLVDEKTTLPVALDEVLSLAAQVAAEHDPSVGLGLRVRSVLESKERWLEHLGPHRLIDEDMTPADALGVLPVELWADALALVVRSLPGLGPDSVCRGAGDAPPGGAHKVFDPALADLQALLARARSLLIGDAASNREVRSVLSGYLKPSGTAGPAR